MTLKIDTAHSGIHADSSPVIKGILIQHFHHLTHIDEIHDRFVAFVHKLLTKFSASSFLCRMITHIRLGRCAYYVE